MATTFTRPHSFLPVVTQAVAGGEGAELIPVETARPVPEGAKPEIPLLVLGDVLYLQAGQAVGRGVGAPGAFATEAAAAICHFGHGSLPENLDSDRHIAVYLLIQPAT